MRLDEGVVFRDGDMVGISLGPGLGVVSETTDVCRWRKWWSFKGVGDCERSGPVEVTSSPTLLSRSTGMSPSSKEFSLSRLACSSSSSRLRGLERLALRASSRLALNGMGCSSRSDGCKAADTGRGCLSLPSKDLNACSCAHEVESCRTCGVGVESRELSSWLDKKAIVGSKDMSVMLRLGVGNVRYVGAEAGRDDVVVAFGRINGFKEHDPEGNRRILRCRLIDLVGISISDGSGSPQVPVPSEEAD